MCYVFYVVMRSHDEGLVVMVMGGGGACNIEGVVVVVRRRIGCSYIPFVNYTVLAQTVKEGKIMIMVI